VNCFFFGVAKLTFGAGVVPFLLCGGETVKVKNATQPHWLEAKIKKCEDETCCLVRPKPSLPAAFAAREKTVRYASAREEFSAYEMPWRDEGGSDVRKLTMIRKPYDRWTSEMLYACRLRGEKPRRVAEAFNFSATRKSVARNRIAQGLVPPVALGKSGLTGDALTGSALEAARGALRSFAFVGVVEHYDRSMCLFARTFLPKTRPICDLCCDHTPHVPHVNAEAAEECDGSVYTEEDRALYDETHAVDRQVYDIALRIFERRWTIAQDHRWGADPDLCRCTFLHHDEHHDDASSSSSPQRDDPALSSAALSSGCCQGGIASVTTVDAAGNATTTTTTALRRGEGNDDEASSSAEEDDGDATR